MSMGFVFIFNIFLTLYGSFSDRRQLIISKTTDYFIFAKRNKFQ